MADNSAGCISERLNVENVEITNRKNEDCSEANISIYENWQYKILIIMGILKNGERWLQS